MMHMTKTAMRTLLVLSILFIGAAVGQDYNLDWYTVDGGGAMFTAGGDFELSGTTGQWDAGYMTGGDFELIGGFWGVTEHIGPDCPSDLSGDGQTEAYDLALLLGAWGPCSEPCTPGDPDDTCAADLSGDCVVEAYDLAILLGAWGPCE